MTPGQLKPVDQWILNYSLLNQLIQFDVVVLQQNNILCTPEVIEYLKANGVDHVLGFISIGEDFSNTALVGDGSGPQALTGSDLAASDGGIASFYVDVDDQTVTYNADGSIDSVATNAVNSPDGDPDINPTFLGYMVNPNSHWRNVIDNMRIDSNDVPDRENKAGLKQIAGARNTSDLRNRAGNFGFDGFFLDTIDTAGPYEGAGWYPWTVDEMRDTVKFISDTYTNKAVLANRGLFYYTAGLKSPDTKEYSIDYSIRPYVNAVLFESYMYDSAPPPEGQPEGPNGESEFFTQNKHQVMPKIMAEANRDDGFTVFNLEYLSGRNSTAIVNIAFDEDIRNLGTVAYLSTGRDLNTVDFYFANLLPDSSNDNNPPQWVSTANTSAGTETPPNLMREGVQQVYQVAANGAGTTGDVYVRWDIATDQSLPVTYDILVTDSLNQTTTYSQVVTESGSLWDTNPTNRLCQSIPH